MTRSHPRTLLLASLSIFPSILTPLLRAQDLPPLLLERFDGSVPPALPPGWSASAARDPGGDFIGTVSGANSPPGCVVSSNATVGQSLTAPPLDFGDWRECTVSWQERRSSTHDASIVLEASTDGGATTMALSDGPLPPPGGTSYAGRRVVVPAAIEGIHGVLLRWRVAGDGTGATGTIRLDDVSVTGRPRSDLSMSAGQIAPARPLAGEEFRCRGYVVNDGFEEASGILLAWGIDADRNGSIGTSEILETRDPGAILPGDSAAFEFAAVRPASSPLTAAAIAIFPRDMAASNDTAFFGLPAVAARRAVVVNEIMYDPLPGKPEYVELYNRSGGDLDLGGWRLTDDADDSTGGDFGEEGTVLEAGGYLLCSPDTSLAAEYPDIPAGTRIIAPVRSLSLNNGGDLVLLVDGAGWPVDSVVYDPSWHTPVLDFTQGRSLERVTSGTGDGDSWNWGSSAGASGGTPGYRNSLAAEAAPRGEDLSFSPNPFSPDGDGFEDVTVIGYRLGEVSAVARVRIYDRDGRLVRTLTGSSYVPGAGSFVWNGYDDRGRRVPVGIYVVLLDAVDGSGVAAVAVKGVVVAAGRL